MINNIIAVWQTYVQGDPPKKITMDQGKKIPGVKTPGRIKALISSF